MTNDHQKDVTIIFEHHFAIRRGRRVNRHRLLRGRELLEVRTVYPYRHESRCRHPVTVIFILLSDDPTVTKPCRRCDIVPEVHHVLPVHVAYKRMTAVIHRHIHDMLLVRRNRCPQVYVLSVGTQHFPHLPVIQHQIIIFGGKYIRMVYRSDIR